ncbi:MAG: hypothetical protein SOY60_07995 [Fusobacterium gastrosuis]|uniref:hypothetical protein n=1 Tax=Fusobacterium TaxID=848 RepID=UPI001F500279|nr:MULTISPECIES: hypothetical protein [Fusobacterium]MCI7223394.1 hypothetical protein [Fusobacterium sp.]MDD7410481.1 hypothetical protein [Fusobacteriaceae bacterium]MDY4011593.1 hypothetical protein [Fusobacterium gastrosuis]MDY5712814.1 hypothetical protein [Fusobacterium gastrosuis]
MSVFSSLFGKDKEKEYQRKIEELEKKLAAKEDEISNLIAELEKANNKVSPKQFGIIERNIKESQEKATRYAKIIASFGLNPDKKYYKYKLEVSKFFTGTKFTELLEVLTKNNIEFIDDLTDVTFFSLLNGVKNVEEAKKKFADYKNNKFDWDVAALINRGDKLSKIYSSRKLLNVFSELSLEYMDDIDNFDFSSLKIYNFSYPQIEEFKTKRDEYYKDRRI